MEDLRDDENETAGANINASAQARSLICKDCGKKFRDQIQAEYHAGKTEHANFEESTDEIAPLTEDEKKAKLAELRENLAAKRAIQSEQDRANKKRNEEIARKKTKDSQEIKEELQKKEQIKEAAKKRQEKLDDIEAKNKIKARIEADKAERRLKAEQEKAARAGQLVPGLSNVSQAAIAAPAAPKPSANHSEARLRLQTPSGTVQKTFPAETTLFEVAFALAQDSGMQVSSFTTNFPKKTYDGQDLGQTLKEAGLVPSAVLIVR